jgi:hypothetical protein
MSHCTAGRKAFNLKNAHTAPLHEDEAMGSDDGDGDETIDPRQTSGVTSGQRGKSTKRKRRDSPGDPAAREAHELDQDIAMAKRVAPFIRISLTPFLPS